MKSRIEFTITNDNGSTFKASLDERGWGTVEINGKPAVCRGFSFSSDVQQTPPVRFSILGLWFGADGTPATSPKEIVPIAGRDFDFVPPEGCVLLSAADLESLKERERKHAEMKKAAAEAIPPLGVCPRNLWDEENPNPTADEILDRMNQVTAACNRRYGTIHLAPPAWEKEIEFRASQLRAMPTSEVPAIVRRSKTAFLRLLRKTSKK